MFGTLEKAPRGPTLSSEGTCRGGCWTGKQPSAGLGEEAGGVGEAGSWGGQPLERKVQQLWPPFEAEDQAENMR